MIKKWTCFACALLLLVFTSCAKDKTTQQSEKKPVETVQTNAPAFPYNEQENPYNFFAGDESYIYYYGLIKGEAPAIYKLKREIDSLPEKLLSAEDFDEYEPKFHSDNFFYNGIALYEGHLFFTVNTKEKFQLYRVSTDGKDLRPIARDLAELDPEFTPRQRAEKANPYSHSFVNNKTLVVWDGYSRKLDLSNNDYVNTKEAIKGYETDVILAMFPEHTYAIRSSASGRNEPLALTHNKELIAEVSSSYMVTNKYVFYFHREKNAIIRTDLLGENETKIYEFSHKVTGSHAKIEPQHATSSYFRFLNYDEDSIYILYDTGEPRDERYSRKGNICRMSTNGELLTTYKTIDFDTISNLFRWDIYGDYIYSFDKYGDTRDELFISIRNKENAEHSTIIRNEKDYIPKEKD